ncbi:tyrosine-type recombinase/integrase [Rhizobium sp. Leaf306]|uniref:tyrosine-type recombinase/integrase n=1 Tax=Rhizobium sp. Leaf306 TaxID=1736330 RepID=UPI000A48AD13|nr:tyrosine-type recombinase/integrase [Rhizobium sp. Leaf306]
MLQDIVTSEKTAFLAHCRKVRGLSNNSVCAYEQDIAAFLAFIRQGDQKHALNGQLVLDYLDHLKRERNHKHATIRRRLVTLRAFATWLRKAGRVGEDPFAGLEIDLRPPNRLPRPVEWVDVRTMLKADGGTLSTASSGMPAFSSELHPLSRTTGLAIKLMVSTGVRVGELTQIKLSNISNDGYRIRIHGKGSKERNVYIGNLDLRTELQHIKWQASRIEHDGDYPASQQPSTTPDKRSGGGFEFLHKPAILIPRVTPHRFRHSAATFLIEEGVDIRFVQRLLGHASIATTEIYTRVSDTALMRAINNADTLGKMLSEFT